MSDAETTEHVLHPTLARLLAAARATGMRPISEGTVAEGRAMIAASTKALGVGPEVRECRTIVVPTRAGSLPALFLLPEGRPAGLCVFLHGGGWVIGAPADYEVMARALTVRSECALLVPDYRLAPEHQFPAGLEDCEDVLLWAAEEREHLVGWAAPLVVSGDSAGGNLATVAARRLRGRVTLAGQALVYPVVAHDFAAPSYSRYGAGLPLSADDMRWFYDHYTPPEQRSDPDIAPLLTKDFVGCPPATVALAECDVLHDEGVAYARRLEEVGLLVALREYPAVTHGFVRLHNYVDTADRAVSDLAEDIARFAGPRV